MAFGLMSFRRSGRHLGSLHPRYGPKYVSRNKGTTADQCGPELPRYPGRRRPALFYDLGEVPYKTAWSWQQVMLKERLKAKREGEKFKDAIIMLEHPEVYTLGKGATVDNLRFDPEVSPFEVHRVERGGEVTYHGPGQLVVYPILDLEYHKKDLHWYIRMIEEVVMRVVNSYGLTGERSPEHTGVWVGQRKVAAVGMNVGRWITTHGFAVNVCPNMAGFQRIIPCGIADQGLGVCSLQQLLAERTRQEQQLGAVTNTEESVIVSEVLRSGRHLDSSEADGRALMAAVRRRVAVELEVCFGLELEQQQSLPLAV